MNQVKYLKAVETKKRILDAALTLFLEEGYEKTTMRKIAQIADLTPGAAYYYFKTKEHIIFHYYEKSYDDHLDKVTSVLDTKELLKDRIIGVMRAHIDIAQPYQEISRALYKVASTPGHALSPFSEESKALRDKNIDIFRQVISGAKDKTADVLQERLPELLWLYKVGLITYWIFDESENHRKTYLFIEKASDWLVKIIKIAHLPIVKNFTVQLLDIFEEFKPY